MSAKKTVSTHQLSLLFNTSGDNIIRDLEKAGLKPVRTTTLGNRSYRSWNREMAVTRLQEIRADRAAKVAARRPNPAIALRDTVPEMQAQLAAMTEQLTKLTEIVTVTAGQVGEIESTLASFMTEDVAEPATAG